MSVSLVKATDTPEHWTLWVCESCLFHHANGECGDCHADNGHNGYEPLSQVDYSRSSLGMFHEEHSEDCLFNTMGSDAPDDYECECEQNTFSTSSCDGCGSHFHGARYAMTEWEK